MKRIGTRTLLACAATAALVVGSAGSASAHGNPHGPKAPKAPVAAVSLVKVDIHRHSPINVNSADTARDLRIRLVVRDTGDAKPTGATVTLAQFASKHSAAPVATSTLVLTADAFTVKANKKNTWFALSGVVPQAQLVALGQGATPALPVGSKPVRMCISDVQLLTGDPATSLPYTKASKQTHKRLGTHGKRAVRECVWLYNRVPVAPTPAPAPAP